MYGLWLTMISKSKGETMGLDELDRAAMREGRAISKLRGFRGSRTRAKNEERNQIVSDEQFQRAWASIGDQNEFTRSNHTGTRR